MIYAEHRFIFIHIPRTGGNSICSAVSESCVGKGVDVLISTAGHIGRFHWLKRHARGMSIHRHIDEWDKIYKFAVVRPVEDILDSVVRLIRRDFANGVHLESTCPVLYREILMLPDPYPHFRKLWDRFGDPEEAFCKDHDGSDLGVDIIQFDDLAEQWQEITERCNIPYAPLPHLNKA